MSHPSAAPGCPGSRTATTALGSSESSREKGEISAPWMLMLPDERVEIALVADIRTVEPVGYAVNGSFRELMVQVHDTVPHTVNVVTAGNPPGQPIEVALEAGACQYRFVRRYLERHPQAPLSLRQVDPLIRQLTLYRDLIDQKTGVGAARDAGPRAGGMMHFGIPAYRLPRDVLAAEVARGLSYAHAQVGQLPRNAVFQPQVIDKIGIQLSFFAACIVQELITDIF